MKKSFGCLLGLVAATYLISEKIMKNNEAWQKYLLSPSFSTIQFPLKKEDVVIPISELIPMYTDCDQKTYNHRTPVYAKTGREIIDGVRRRKSLEELWVRYFKEQVIMSYSQMRHIDTTQKWYDPLNGDGWFNNSFKDIRVRAGSWRERHKAIDIFAGTGSYISAPVSGIVIASEDNWEGSWKRKGGLRYESGGLGELSGNGIILFNPVDTSYYFMIHMKDVYARAGDVVSRGRFVGTVGNTGNAISPYVSKHLHLAHKKPGKACGIEGVLVAQNPYGNLIETTSVSLAQK